MQVTELRIGNIIKFENSETEIVRVEEIYKEHPYPHYFIEWTLLKGSEDSFEEGDYLLSEFEPIALSPLLLEKACGFKGEEEEISAYEGYNAFKTYTKDFFSIDYLYNGAQPDKFEFEYHNGRYDVTIEIKYLHQLQNLYFTLSGKELLINL